MRRALIPGSFDPVTLGHLNIICRAAGNYDEVVVGIFENPEKHYLFTLGQRAALLREATQNLANVRVVACDGYTADYAKEGGFAAIVRGYRSDSDLTYEQKMAQYNSGRGGVHTLLLETPPELAGVSSTRVRERLAAGESISGLVPESCRKTVLRFYRENTEHADA